MRYLPILLKLYFLALRRCLSCTILGLVSLCPLVVNATQQIIPPSTLGNKSTLHIKADQFSFDRKTNKVIFMGHVKITNDPGTIILADTLWLFTNDQHQLQKAVFFGNPVDYHADKTTTQEATHATAKTMTYDQLTQLVTLTGDAHIEQGDNSFSGPEVRYDMQHKIVMSQASTSQKVSVELVVDQNHNQLLRTP